VIEQGLLLTVIGMVMVFVFLLTLNYALKGLSVLIKFSEKHLAAQGAKPAALPAAAGKPALPETAAAVAAASEFLKKQNLRN
jgi:sodium pump decarboxylase gamma subunit